MASPPEPSERELADLAALADGSLPLARREELEARLASSAELRMLLEEQRHAVRLVTQAGVRAPLSLRERLEERRQRGAHPARRRRLRLAAGLAAALGAVAVLVVLVLPGGTPGGPTIVQAAAFTMRGPRALAPSHSDGSRVVSVAVDGNPFPYWSDACGWKTSGLRTDRLDGRYATT
jgi:hypothetical protein